MTTKLILLVCLYHISKVTSYAEGSGYSDYLIGRVGGAFVSLFDYTFPEIEQACIDSVGPWGYFGIHISPPQKSKDVGQHTWWDRYQPETYDIEDRDGNGEEAFYNMTTTCRDYGVRIIVDAVINHMYSGYVDNLPGENADYTWQIPGDTRNTHLRPAQRYKANAFHDVCQIQSSDYVNNSWRVRNCQLAELDDLKTEWGWVRRNILKYLNRLLALGASGFRIDAAKHMNPADTKVFLRKMKNVRSDFFGGGRPWVFTEVIDKDGSEAISENEYLYRGRKRTQNLVTEFTAGIHLKNEWFGTNFYAFETFSSWSNMLPSSRAVAFVTNHDEERYPWMFNYKDGTDYELANIFLLTYNYGTVKVHSGYNFNLRDEGRPYQPASMANCQWYGGNWTCDHLWRGIRNAVGWRNEAFDATEITNWWDNRADGGNCLAFSRVSNNKGGFVAINRGGDPCILDGIDTGLPKEYYCELYSSDVDNCTSFSVDKDGLVESWGLLGQEAVIIHTGATTDVLPILDPYRNSTVRCVGDFLSELGGTDWDETNSQCIMSYNSATKTYIIETNVTTGNYEFKIVVDGNWATSYPSGNNIAFESLGYVKFIFNPFTLEASVVLNPYENNVIRGVGDFLSELGGTDWTEDNDECILEYNDDTGTYEKEITDLPAGSYQFKITVDGSWTENYGENGVFNGNNIQFTSTGTVIFYWNPFTLVPSISVGNDTTTPANPYANNTIRCTGDFVSQLGGSDWDAGNSQCIMTYSTDSYLYETTLVLSNGDYQLKITVDGSWTENYGENGVFNGANLQFTSSTGLVLVTWDPLTKIPTVENVL